MTRNLRRLNSTEADTLRTITDWLDLQMAQGKLLYMRHNPSTVISKVVRGKIKTAFKKVRESQLGAVDLIVFRRKRIEVTKFYYVDVTDVLLIEVKSPTGQLSKAQDRWAELAVAQGCRYLIARSLDDVMQALR